jgi:hypothetical protein
MMNYELGDKIDWEEIAEHYDYVLISNEQYIIWKVPSVFREIYKGEGFRMLKVRS